MNSVLVLCPHCLRILGCAAPRRKSCRTCTTHDCPTLPAPAHTGESCDRCAPLPARPHSRPAQGLWADYEGAAPAVTPRTGSA
ncbi:MAG: hypothetical protein Kow0092_25160 [Deferrisomatales bacterium]